jgi:hypothetical protein
MNTENRTHLLRGAPCVRSWSKYQKTVKEWTLCGIRRVARGSDKTRVASTEVPGAVSCPYCLDLMRPSARAAVKRRVA